MAGEAWGFHASSTCTAAIPLQGQVPSNGSARLFTRCAQTLHPSGLPKKIVAPAVDHCASASCPDFLPMDALQYRKE
jgi:hypothetical protein